MYTFDASLIEKLLQDFDYELGNCPNEIVCKTGKINKYLLNCTKGVCNTCFQNFKKELDILDKKDECPICLEQKNSFVKYPNCEHRICNICFRRCFLGEKMDKEPKFPYPEYENEWYTNNYHEYRVNLYGNFVSNPEPGKDWPQWAKDIFEDVINYDLEYQKWSSKPPDREENLKKCLYCRI